MTVMRVMFSTPQWVDGRWTTQAEIDVVHVQAVSASGEAVVNAAAEHVVMLSVGDLPKTYVQAVRAQRPNAYRAWSEEDDRLLIEMHAAKAPMKERIELLGRRYGAVRSRMRKLGLVDKDQ